MNERQNTVVATAVSGLILVLVFLCPWRIESSNELRWSPIYQSPMTYVQTYDTQQSGSRIKSEEAHIAVGILAIEVLSVIVAADVLYVIFADSEDEEGAPPEALN